MDSILDDSGLTRYGKVQSFSGDFRGRWLALANYTRHALEEHLIPLSPRGNI
jgi:hypothetical protein